MNLWLKWKNSTTLALLLPVLLLASCKSKIPLQTFTVDGDRAYKQVEKLVALGPRPSNTDAARKAADHIAAVCKELGYTPELDEWTEDTANGNMTFRNVYAELKGNGKKFVIVGSHFDTKVIAEAPLFVGANDSGSSTGLLLEIMKVLKDNEAKWDGPTLRFAFFDGEECLTQYGPKDGLHGSKRMARKLVESKEVKKCRAMVLLDMIGDKDLNVTMPRKDDPKLIKKVLKIAADQGVADHFTVYKGDILDDHVPFKDLGIPAVDLIDFDFGDNNGHWHTGADTMDKISPKSLQIVGNVTIRLLQELRD